MELPTHQVRDGDRLLTFEGQLLAHISSQRDTPRWTEMSLYKTVAGTYVLEKVGRSIVTHIDGCPAAADLTRFQEAHPGKDPDDFEFHECVPDEYDFTKLRVESDRYWSTLADKPSLIVDALYRNRAGQRTMPRMSLDLLHAASEIEPALKEAYLFERIA
jgi:hypothetical protein